MSTKTLTNAGKLAINQDKAFRHQPKTKYEIYSNSDIKLFDDKSNDSPSAKNDQPDLDIKENINKRNYSKKQEEITDSKIRIIEEANKILNERSKNRGLSLTTRPKGKVAFITDTKEVSLKNYLINQLKDERTVLNDKELAIQQDLKQSEYKLQNDMAQFNNYVEKEKDYIKQGESDLLLETYKKKVLTDQRNELVKERKQLIDDLERNIKNINNLKNISQFVHKLMGIKQDNSDSFSISLNQSKRETLIPQSNNSINVSKISDAKEAKVEQLTDEILNEFRMIGPNTRKTKEILSDYKLLLVKFSEMEEKILKMMEKKEEQEKDISKLKEKFNSEINDLKKNEQLVLLEKKKIEEEFIKDQKTLSILQGRLHDGGETAKFHELLKEVYFECFPKEIKKKVNDDMLIKPLMEYLKNKENDIKGRIYLLETYPQQHVLAQAEKRKEKNKETTRKENQEKKKLENEIKNQKARERMNRIVIKGRNVMTHFKPKDDVKNEIKNEMKNDDCNNLLSYDT